MVAYPAYANPDGFFAEFPRDYTTTSGKMLAMGTVIPAKANVPINGKTSKGVQVDNFYTSLPLAGQDNVLYLSYLNQDHPYQQTQLVSLVEANVLGTAAVSSSVDIANLGVKLWCLGTSLAPKGYFTLPLLAESQPVELLTFRAKEQPDCQPASFASSAVGGDFIRIAYGMGFNLGYPQSLLSFREETNIKELESDFQILPPFPLQIVEVKSDSGITRTGPSDESSRLTPLPQSTRAKVTGRQGEWLRLDYGAWINSNETQFLGFKVPTSSIINNIKTRKIEGKTEIIFPLDVPVPIAVEQGKRTFSLTLYNTKAQKDVIPIDNNPIIAAVDWEQTQDETVKYTFNLKNNQQWGYHLRYEGNSLILSLRHPPKKPMFLGFYKPLAGVKIVLDPGHGGDDFGAIGPNKYTEKQATLTVSMLLRDELTRRGATVYMTREEDKYLSLRERVDIINNIEPTIALSVHYNAIPDDGNPEDAKGIGMFWYHPQAKKLAGFLHDSLVENLQRPSHGVRWQNLALARPTTAPSVLMELGFISHPSEADWVANPWEQQRLAAAVADSIAQWFEMVRE
ncbi:MAG: N-acetylmuramoyl-L-alanine amidase [Nostocaceae cyanobacterium]|nr:N-acetylmuramoyl-L-alanine amidase [Nostocaceae cyanobacterium]